TKIVSLDRQKFGLLIYNGIFDDAISSVSAAVGCDRSIFQVHRPEQHCWLGCRKRPSAFSGLAGFAISSIPCSLDNAFALNRVPEQLRGSRTFRSLPCIGRGTESRNTRSMVQGFISAHRGRFRRLELQAGGRTRVNEGAHRKPLSDRNLDAM